jgi:hypothetical protein
MSERAFPNPLAFSSNVFYPESDHLRNMIFNNMGAVYFCQWVLFQLCGSGAYNPRKL